MSEIEKIEETLTTLRRDCKETHEQLAKRMEKTLKTGVASDLRIKHLEEWQRRQNGSLKDISDDLARIRSDIHEMKVESVGGKPTWMVAIIITILSSTVVGFIASSI